MQQNNENNLEENSNKSEAQYETVRLVVNITSIFSCNFIKTSPVNLRASLKVIARRRRPRVT